MEEKKISRKFFWILFVLIIFLIIIILIYFSIFNNSNSSIKGKSITLTNPVLGLSNEQAIEQFNETFVLYLLASIGAQRLHNIPLSSNAPKIEVHIDNEVYSALIISEGISLGRGYLENPDIRIKTVKSEAVKMLRDKVNVGKSFAEGKSSIELIAGKATLFSKGYLDLYNGIKGKSKA